MKLVIDIPEEIIIACMQHNRPVDCEMFANKMVLDIANGTPLPKGHGRLIDADELYAEFADGTEGVDFSHWTRADIAEAIDDAPTIIEEERSEHEQKA